MWGVDFLFYGLAFFGVAATIIYCLKRKDFSFKNKIQAILIILGMSGVMAVIGFFFAYAEDFLPPEWISCLYLALNAILLISVFIFTKFFIIKEFLIILTLFALSSNHVNIILLIILINFEAVYLHFRRRKYTNTVLSEDDGEDDFFKDENYKEIVNISFITVYILLITMAFGSFFCTDEAYDHFAVGLKSYFSNDWTNISLIQKIEGVIMGSVFISYATDIIKKKVFASK